MKTRSWGPVSPSVLALLGMVFAAAPLLAQVDVTSGAASVERVASEVKDPTKIRAVDSALWREMGLKRADLPARLLDVLSEKNLMELAAGEDPATVETMSGESVLEVLAIGDVFAELVYQPVNPCRLVNTLNAGGAFAGGEARNYDLIGPTNYAGIGGNPAGCGIPGPVLTGAFSYNPVRALNLNYISVAPGGPGDFRAWPTNQAVPLASVLNYANVGGGLNIANGLVTTTCTAFCLDIVPPFTCLSEPCPSGDLSVQADVSGTHLIIDVYGFFIGADTTHVRGTSDEGERTLAITVGETCTNVTSCTISNPSSSSKGVVVVGSANYSLGHTVGLHEAVSINIATANNVCDLDPVAPGGAIYEFPSSAQGTLCCFDGTLTTTKRFSIAAGATVTYYLNAQGDLGGAGSLVVDSATIECIFDP